MGDPTYPVMPAAVALPVLALITLIIDTPPIIWHIRNRNLAASSLVFWIAIANLMNFINPFIWQTDDISSWWPGYGLCDVEVKLQLGVSIGTISSLLCIMRNLARVLDTDKAVMSLSKAQRRRQVVEDCLLCFGAPAYFMIIHYFVQSSRFYVLAISGCTASFDPSWPVLPLLLIWPLVFCLVNVCYATLVIIRMHRYRKTFSEVLASSNSSHTKNRFMRLFWMAFTLIVIIFPVQCLVLYKNTMHAWIPYDWDKMHGSGFWDITFVPSAGAVDFDRWIDIGAGFLVFFFFGMGQDAKTVYRKWLLKLGFGKLFPSLARERTVSPPNNLTGSQTSSIGRRARLFVAKKISRDSASSQNSNSQRSPVQLSSNLPTTSLGHLSTTAERSIRRSESTITSTPQSREKKVEAGTTPELSWLGRFLVNTHIAANESIEHSGGSRARTGRGEATADDKDSRDNESILKSEV